MNCMGARHEEQARKTLRMYARKAQLLDYDVQFKGFRCGASLERPQPRQSARACHCEGALTRVRSASPVAVAQGHEHLGDG